MSGKAARNIKPIKDDRKTRKFSIIIPSAGEGSRMRSFGPRSLIQLTSGKTILEYQISLLKNFFPVSDIIIVTGFEANKLMNKVPHGTICIENERYNDTNVLRSIGMGLRAAVNEHVLIVYGDLVFNSKLLEFPINKSCTLYSHEESIQGDNEVGCTVNNSKLENIFYGLSNKWIPIVYLQGRELKLMKNIAFDKQKERLYGFEAMNEILGQDGEFDAYCPVGSKCIDIDSSRDLEKVKNVI